ncbi:MAG: YafY family transcriptional regulator [Defluviitaleaceae bacterium]|nr:YafY family transcriptional regulator [Defluviitaleaceae bacterium]
MQINRLFEIIYILLDKKKVTAKELTAHFGVSRQTIIRDLDTLSTVGIPIYTERGKGGGIRLLPDFVLNKSILSEQEQNEILSALHGLSNVKTNDTTQVLQKLSTIFNKPTTNWLEVDFSGWTHENDFFNAFKEAILAQRIIEFNYYNMDGDKTFRRIEPMQVWFKSKAWYLKGFCLTKQGMRLYRLSRIKNLTVTDEHFCQRDSLDISGNPISSIYEGGKNVQLKLHIAPEKAYRVFDDLYESMVEKQSDGSFITTMTWPETTWLYDFILSFGQYIEVIEPKHIREIIKSEAEKISGKYL